jgi:homoserine kinase
MNLKRVKVLVPATTANLGPGFDCLGVALDLWNEVTFTLQGSHLAVEIYGEGEGVLPANARNLVVQAFNQFCEQNHVAMPAGLQVVCRNQIPLGSGLGSSAAAVLAGLYGASEMLGIPASTEQILAYANQIEGHPDNAAAALYGGLVVSAAAEQGLITRRFDLPDIPVAIALGEIDLPTHAARAALPQSISLNDAIFNISRSVLVVEALRSGDLDLLSQSMQDRLHQPYRLPLMPGAAEAMQAALTHGARAAAISGAGPSMIAFANGDTNKIASEMQKAYQSAGTPARAFCLRTTNQGIIVERG